MVMFLHTLFLHPDIARRVYEEVQSVTYGERLPKISDRSSLPYSEAVFKEAMRINPSIPLGQYNQCPLHLDLAEYELIFIYLMLRNTTRQ
jgi:cytochrome P450